MKVGALVIRVIDAFFLKIKHFNPDIYQLFTLEYSGKLV